MSRSDITCVRLYLAEGSDNMKAVLKRLEQLDVRGFTVFRGIEGIGSHHQLHKATFLDLSASLPIVIEFFDQPERVTHILGELKDWVKPDNVVSWPAQSGI
jgi:hypothetical protein